MELGEPDDDLLRRVLVKLFADRQLAVDSAVVDYIVVRMERSLQAANALVDDLDREALAAGGRSPGASPRALWRGSSTGGRRMWRSREKYSTELGEIVIFPV